MAKVLREERFTLPLWEKFSKEVLLSEAEKLGSKRTFDRGFHLRVYSDNESTFPSFPRIKHPLDPPDIIGKKWPRYAGVDPFGKNIVLFVLAISPQGIRYPVEIMTKIPRDQLFEVLIESRKRHKIQLFCVESNAAQIFIVDGVKLKSQLMGGRVDFPVAACVTGAATKKVGFASLEVEFANGLWFWPAGREPHEFDCSCGGCLWEEEMTGHPDLETWDTVIACYYAREAARIEGEDDFSGYESISFS